MVHGIHSSTIGMPGIKDILLAKIRDGEQLSLGELVKLVIFLSIPTLLAQLSSVLMGYIDTAMVGRLGASESASIGLISTSTWLFHGFCMATSCGFSVQIAHLIGSNNFKQARQVLREGLVSALIFGLLLGGTGMAISSRLPVWLGGSPEIVGDAAGYFFIFCAFIPFYQICHTAGYILQASGNTKVPSILNMMMCGLDVIFNFIFIFGLGMGVKGAALGTGVAELVTAVLMLGFLVLRSPELNLKQDSGSYLPKRRTLSNAFKISSPMWLQNAITRGAHIMSTIIIAPLGPVAIAANSFAITAESFCYMPGYGLQDASTAIIGQSLGAGRKDLARRFARITISMGAGIMAVLAVFMFIFAPELMGILSIDPAVVDLGANMLRIVAFAEAMFGVSIVAYGCCVGAGDTLVPSIMNLGSMWIVRIGLALILTPRLGLKGYWIAMSIELVFRGAIFILRIHGKRWLNSRFA